MHRLKISCKFFSSSRDFTTGDGDVLTDCEITYWASWEVCGTERSLMSMIALGGISFSGRLLSAQQQTFLGHFDLGAAKSRLSNVKRSQSLVLAMLSAPAFISRRVKPEPSNASPSVGM
jgi:hypothetical protein